MYLFYSNTIVFRVFCVVTFTRQKMQSLVNATILQFLGWLQLAANFCMKLEKASDGAVNMNISIQSLII